MNNNRNKRRSILKAALWGGIIFGGFTLAMGLCDTYGPKGIPQGIGIILGPFITGAPDAVLHALGYDLKPMPTVLAWLNGSLFAAAINFLVGAAVLALLAFVVQFLTKRKQQK